MEGGADGGTDQTDRPVDDAQLDADGPQCRRELRDGPVDERREQPADGVAGGERGEALEPAVGQAAAE